MALRELSRHEILQAVAEYDRLGKDPFLAKYGFGAARSYRLVVDGKTYDSKAIVGAAHGFLPGQKPLAAADFSGGAATVGRLLSRLGFQVTQVASGLTVGKLIELLSALRPYRSTAGRQALYQPLALLWAIGRAHQGLARMAEWSATEAARARRRAAALVRQQPACKRPALTGLQPRPVLGRGPRGCGSGDSG